VSIGSSTIVPLAHPGRTRPSCHAAGRGRHNRDGDILRFHQAAPDRWIASARRPCPSALRSVCRRSRTAAEMIAEGGPLHISRSLPRRRSARQTLSRPPIPVARPGSRDSKSTRAATRTVAHDKQRDRSVPGFSDRRTLRVRGYFSASSDPPVIFLHHSSTNCFVVSRKPEPASRPEKI
jgi:hypothetical protein